MRISAVVGASLLAAGCGVLFATAGSQAMAVVFGFLIFTLIYFLVAIMIAGYVPELFPTALRMRGNGVCNTVGRLTTIFVPYAVVALYAWGGVTAVLFGVEGTLIVLALAVGIFGVETSRRSLEQIAAI